MRSPRFFSLRNKFLLVSALNIVIPLVLVVGVSYSRTVAVLEGEVSRSNFQYVEQMADNLSMVFTDMKNSSVYLLQNKEFLNHLRMPASEMKENPGHLLSVQKFINNYLAFNPSIQSIYLETFNGLAFDSQSAKNVVSAELRARLLKLKGEGVVLPDVITHYNGEFADVFSYVKIIKDPDNLAVDLALLKINIPQTLVTDTFTSMLRSPNSDFYLVDEAGRVVSGLRAESAENPLPGGLYEHPELTKIGGYFKWDLDGRETMVTYRNLYMPAWKLVHLVPLQDLSQDIAVIRNFTLASILLSLLCCFAIVAFFSLYVLSPLKQLRKAMGQVEKEDFSVNIPVRGNDEVALLSRSFNKMSHKLDELVNQVLAVEIKQKEAELKALQAQINPHFLYNTLDTIYWTCRMENAEDSAALVKSLSRLFRLSLNSGNEFTSLGKEVEHLLLYIAIQQKRFEGQILFDVEAPEALADCPVVKLILQPLVENSIVHGIEKNGGSGSVKVCIFREGEQLVYTVTDDGAGADKHELEAYLLSAGPENRGFALSNVNQRIQIYHGDAYGMSFETAPGKGMTVRVTQPIRPNVQSEGGAE